MSARASCAGLPIRFTHVVYPDLRPNVKLIAV